MPSAEVPLPAAASWPIDDFIFMISASAFHFSPLEKVTPALVTSLQDVKSELADADETKYGTTTPSARCSKRVSPICLTAIKAEFEFVSFGQKPTM